MEIDKLKRSHSDVTEFRIKYERSEMELQKKNDII
jgi:flagellar motor switch protein FliM